MLECCARFIFPKGLNGLTCSIMPLLFDDFFAPGGEGGEVVAEMLMGNSPYNSGSMESVAARKPVRTDNGSTNAVMFSLYGSIHFSTVCSVELAKATNQPGIAKRDKNLQLLMFFAAVFPHTLPSVCFL